MDIRPYYGPATLPKPDRRIPARFIQTWKTSHFDDEHGAMLRDFRLANLDHDFEFFDDADVDKYMLQEWGTHSIYKIYKGSPFGASRADIFRTCNLYQHGGIALDIDAHVRFSLSQIPKEANEYLAFENNLICTYTRDAAMPNHDFFAQRNFENNRVGHPKHVVLQWCTSYRPRHRILGMFIDALVNRAGHFNRKVYASIHDPIVNYTGPLTLTEMVWRYLDCNNSICEAGIDFCGEAVYKKVPANGTYNADQTHFGRHGNTFILSTQ